MSLSKKRARLAVIGGSGLEKLFIEGKPTVVKTRYGLSPDIYFHKLDGLQVAFLARHGVNHVVPPHLINSRANINALKILGVERIISLNAVGSLRRPIKPGNFLLPHDFIDFTKSRASTFFDGSRVIHVDMTEPYCSQLRGIVSETAKEDGLDLIQRGVYVCTEGPRFESPAEIRLFRKAGADVVGMTGLPEAVLAREAEICYCSVCVVTNFAAGMQRKLSSKEVNLHMRQTKSRLTRLIEDSLRKIPNRRECICSRSLEEAGA